MPDNKAFDHSDVDIEVGGIKLTKFSANGDMTTMTDEQKNSTLKSNPHDTNEEQTAITISDGTDLEDKNEDNPTTPNQNDDVDDDSDYESDDENRRVGALCVKCNQITEKFKDFKKKYSCVIVRVFKCIMLLLYLAYFGYAMHYEFGSESSFRLLVCTIIGLLILCQRYIGIGAEKILSYCRGRRYTNLGVKLTKWGLYLGMPVFAALYIVMEIGLKRPQNLSSLAGMVGFLLICVPFSFKVAKVRWHTVFSGVALQFLAGIIVLRTTWGFGGIMWLADRVNELMVYGLTSSASIFGQDFNRHLLVFGSFPLIFFINALISVLYHVGAMAWIIRNIGRFLAFSLGCTPAESMSVAANIFIGSQQAALSLHPYLGAMSSSEVFALMTGGFASIDVSVIAIYAGFGADPRHLIAASIMSAPASLAVAKLLVPEKGKRNIYQDFSRAAFHKFNNIVEAASSGAMAGLKVYGNILINLYAFYAILMFLNATLSWFGARVGLPQLTFKMASSYVLYPLPLLMGVDSEDRRGVAKLIGIMLTGSNAFGFMMLGQFRENRNVFTEYTANPNNTWYYVNDDIYLTGLNTTLTDGILSERSATIATYAMCGFSNFAGVGGALGVFKTLIPHRKAFIAKTILIAMCAGNISNYLTACIAGGIISAIAQCDVQEAHQEKGQHRSDRKRVKAKDPHFKGLLLQALGYLGPILSPGTPQGTKIENSHPNINT